MGSNRSGVKRVARMKRAKKLDERLAKQQEAKKEPPHPGLLGKVKRLPKLVAAVAGGVVEGVKEGLSADKPKKEKKDKKEKGAPAEKAEKGEKGEKKEKKAKKSE